MLEPQALGGVVQLDVDAEVVGVELEVVAGDDPALFVDVEGEPGDGAVDTQPPVPIAVRVSVERHHPLILYKCRRHRQGCVEDQRVRVPP
jgi:hypothetical protein